MMIQGSWGSPLGGIVNCGCLLSSRISINDVSFTNVSTKWHHSF